MSQPDPVEPPDRDPCVLLEWDSRHFGFPVARVRGDGLSEETATSVDAWCRTHLVRCAYLLLDVGRAKDAAVAAASGFRMTAVRMTFGGTLNRQFPAKASGPVVRAAEPADLPALERIAGQAFVHSRFYSDGRFAPGRCDELYRTWIRRSCEGWADCVLVAEGASGPNGFVTCHLDQAAGAGDIGLIGVDAEIRGRGTGRALMDGTIAWLGSVAARRLRVATQASNIPAQRLFQASGLRTEAVDVWYHKWFD